MIDTNRMTYRNLEISRRPSAFALRWAGYTARAYARAVQEDEEMDHLSRSLRRRLARIFMDAAGMASMAERAIQTWEPDEAEEAVQAAKEAMEAALKVIRRYKLPAWVSRY